MTAKDFLSQGIIIRRKIDSDYERIASLHAQATRTTTVLTGMPRAGLAEGSSSMENALCNKQMIVQDIEMQEMKLKAVLKEIRKIVQQVQQPEWRNVLDCKFVQLLSWRKIMLKTGRSRSTVMEWYRNGLRSVDVILMQQNFRNT